MQLGREAWQYEGEKVAGVLWGAVTHEQVSHCFSRAVTHNLAISGLLPGACFAVSTNEPFAWVLRGRVCCCCCCCHRRVACQLGLLGCLELPTGRCQKQLAPLLGRYDSVIITAFKIL
jgi:hypothetical protein